MSSTYSYQLNGKTRLTFALRPTIANQKWDVYFVGVGDIPLAPGCGKSLPGGYGPAPVVGQWGVYTIPLADLCITGPSVYKFAIQDKTGLAVNTWYVDNAGFAP